MENNIQQTQQAAEFLEQYKWKKREVQRIERRIEEIEDDIGLTAVQFSDMPKSHTNKISRPTETTALRLIELKDKYTEKYRDAMLTLHTIEHTICKVKEPQMVEFLECRYIDGMTMEETAEEMDMSTRHMYRLQTKVLHTVADIMGFSSDMISPDFINAWVVWKNKAIKHLN